MAASLLASCTLSEPETTDNDASTLRLTSLTEGGITVVKIDYDSQNRITEINFGNEDIYTLTYSGSSSVPTTIVAEEYDTYYYVNADDEYIWETKIAEKTKWTNIKADSSGLITSFSVNETRYHYESIWDEESGCETGLAATQFRESYDEKMFYDSNGHIVSYTVDDGITPLEITTFVWEDDLLVSAYDNDTENHENSEFEYSDVENVNLQWDLNNTIIGPLAITGFFGKAPKNFMKSSKEYYQGSLCDYYQYAYSLYDNGLIYQSKLYDTQYDDYDLFTYVYSTIK